MLSIRAGLEPFNYDPAPANDKKKRETRPMVVLDNGAEYEGQWDA